MTTTTTTTTTMMIMLMIMMHIPVFQIASLYAKLNGLKENLLQWLFHPRQPADHAHHLIWHQLLVQGTWASYSVEKDAVGMQLTLALQR